MDAEQTVKDAQFARNDWQPIETAPKDGTHILVYARDCGYPADDCGLKIGFYQGMMYGRLFIGGDISGEDRGEEWTGWLSVSTYDNGHGDSENVHLSPTHWMPLPEPPSQNG